MNNGDFNRQPSPEQEGEPTYRRERKPILPLVVLILGIIGCFNPPFGITAIVLGLVDRHLSRPRWDTKSRIGTILGFIILGVCLLFLLIMLLMYFFVPDFGANIAAGLKEMAAISSSSIRSPFR